MKLNKILIFIIALFGLTSCGGGMTFNDQIMNDITSKMSTGICDSIPSGSTISNVVIGEITPIGDSGLIDVSMTLDYELDGEKKSHTGALLYSKQGSRKKLERIGGCNFEG